MAYTTARTWTDGELVNAAIMNPHVRDNFNAMGPHLIVRKTADESDATTTFQNDDVLTMAVAANKIWMVRMLILVVAGSAVDWTARFNAPAGATLSGNMLGVNATTVQGNNYATSTWPSGSNTFQTQGTLSDAFTFDGVLVNAGTAGSFTLQWTNAAAGTATVKANSTLWAVKLA